MTTNTSELFRHKKSKQVIEIIALDAETGRVRFASQGGGFVQAMTLTSLVTEFEAYKAPNFALGAVSLEMAPDGTSIPAYLNGMRWNGWAMPFFPESSMAQVLLLCPGSTYVPERDEYVIKVDDCEEDMVVPAETIMTVDGQSIKTYAVGAGSWTWDEVQASESLKGD